MASYIICNCQLYFVNVCKLSNIDPMTTSTKYNFNSWNSAKSIKKDLLQGNKNNFYFFINHCLT